MAFQQQEQFYGAIYLCGIPQLRLTATEDLKKTARTQGKYIYFFVWRMEWSIQIASKQQAL